jgi:hypothetical protein
MAMCASVHSLLKKSFAVKNLTLVLIAAAKKYSGDRHVILYSDNDAVFAFIKSFYRVCLVSHALF